MTMNRGMLLFDSPEPPVGKWENQLGYRGLKEVWKLEGTPIILEIDMDDVPDEDPEDCWEVSVANDETGDVRYIAFGSFNECDKAAKKYMSEHHNG
jgi:hypothetical protein